MSCALSLLTKQARYFSWQCDHVTLEWQKSDRIKRMIPMMMIRSSDMDFKPVIPKLFFRADPFEDFC